MRNNKSLFHVHTYRCGHAENVPDETYVRRALELGASDIWFTDHAPFPGDPFRNRMKFSQLPEYIQTLSSLKEKYRQQICIHIGLEIEYFSYFDHSGYYKYLSSVPELEMLLLGQHMAEISEDPLQYTFSLPKEKKHLEYAYLAKAMTDGIRAGYFQAVAHPDRAFRRCHSWTEEMDKCAEMIISAAEDMDIPLEQNEHSKEKKYNFWQQFWEKADGRVKIIHGLDAHKIEELRII